LKRIVTEVGGGEHPVLAKEPVGVGCQATEGEWEESLDLGFLDREAHKSGTLTSYGHQGESWKGATGPAWCGFAQQHFGRAIDGSGTALSDGNELGGEEGDGRKGETNGRQAGLSRKLSETTTFGGDG
jgi:hypothetical protein